MSNVENIKRTLKEYKLLLMQKYDLKRIGIFGSYARGEQSEISDVDILVEFLKPIGWEIIDLKEELESFLGLKVDLVTPNALNPLIREKILKEVVYA